MPYVCGVKLCGLKTPEEVDLAVALGVQAVGFVLSESPRQVTARQARVLGQRVPEKVRTHAVFGPEEPARVRAWWEESALDVAQVTASEEDEAYWEALAGVPLIRGFRVRGRETLDILRSVQEEEFLLDAYVPGRAGGTGVSFDWDLARAAGRFGKVILAGGLTPENVGEAIRTARPHMVDVSGGIEHERGRKDLQRMQAFVEAVTAAVGALAEVEEG